MVVSTRDNLLDKRRLCLTFFVNQNCSGSVVTFVDLLPGRDGLWPIRKERMGLLRIYGAGQGATRMARIDEFLS